MNALFVLCPALLDADRVGCESNLPPLTDVEPYVVTIFASLNYCYYYYCYR